MTDANFTKLLFGSMGLAGAGLVGYGGYRMMQPDQGSTAVKVVTAGSNMALIASGGALLAFVTIVYMGKK